MSITINKTTADYLDEYAAVVRKISAGMTPERLAAFEKRVAADVRHVFSLSVPYVSVVDGEDDNAEQINALYREMMSSLLSDESLDLDDFYANATDLEDDLRELAASQKVAA